jgi:hypothetical protein
VTLGAAIANDVRGKNQRRFGSFGTKGSDLTAESVAKLPAED